MQISGATKKQHDSPRLNRHAAFLFIIFFRLFISCAQAYISLFAPFSQILPASRQTRQICHLSEGYSPLYWAAASSQVSPFRCSSHLSSEYPSFRYFMFFCMQDAVPTRPKQACFFVDKYNMQDFFWDVLFFLKFF